MHMLISMFIFTFFHVHILKNASTLIVDISVVEPEPQGAGTFGWSQNVEVSVPAPGQFE
jgi:hypothetical protein